MQRRVIFNEKLLPYLLLAPQLAVTLIFFFWPAGQAIHMSVLSQDAFGQSVTFVGLDNFKEVLGDAEYVKTLWRTVLFSSAVAVTALFPALLFAVIDPREETLRVANAKLLERALADHFDIVEQTTLPSRTRILYHLTPR